MTNTGTSGISYYNDGVKSPLGTPLVNPCGVYTVRLKDIPLSVRLSALSMQLRYVDGEEAQKLLDVVLFPGDKGGRVAE